MDTELIGLCQKLIQTQSYSGGERRIAELIRDFMRSHGFDEAYFDEYGNVLGCIRGRRAGKRILFDGHIDTVPAENRADWKHDPFGGVIEDGRIYGRGAADMKGADAAMLCALARFRAAHGDDFSGELWFSGIVHEECFEGVAARRVSAALHPSLVVIGEASEMNLKCSQRGRAEIVLETFGVPCHSSNPEKGVNAVYSACRIIEKLRALRTKVAQRAGVPPYVVFSNATLADMAARQPKSEYELLGVRGVGEAKARRYGAEFVDCIRAYLEAK